MAQPMIGQNLRDAIASAIKRTNDPYAKVMGIIAQALEVGLDDTEVIYMGEDEVVILETIARTIKEQDPHTIIEPAAHDGGTQA